jgi:hypothetical protein
LQTAKQKAKRKEKKKARSEQLNKDFGPVFQYLRCLANPAEAPTTDPTAITPAQVDTNPPAPVSVPSLTHRSVKAAHHPNNSVNTVEPPTTASVATTSTEEATGPTQPATVPGLPTTRSPLKSVVVVVENPTYYRESTSSHRPRRMPYERR